MENNIAAVLSLSAQEVTDTASLIVNSITDPNSPVVLVAASDVTVGMVRVVGARVTNVRTSPSGKTVYVTDERMGTERLSPGTRIAIRRA